MSLLWKRNVWKKCTFRRNIEQSQIDDMLAKLITMEKVTYHI